MARRAGLALHERWAGWGQEEFGSSSQFHISVYRRG
jgi:hypothetical protein